MQILFTLYFEAMTFYFPKDFSWDYLPTGKSILPPLPTFNHNRNRVSFLRQHKAHPTCQKRKRDNIDPFEPSPQKKSQKSYRNRITPSSRMGLIHVSKIQINTVRHFVTLGNLGKHFLSLSFLTDLLSSFMMYPTSTLQAWKGTQYDTDSSFYNINTIWCPGYFFWAFNPPGFTRGELAQAVTRWEFFPSLPSVHLIAEPL